jgi:FKBP-type peptidyl-prolyl cis-trans isomerase
MAERADRLSVCPSELAFGEVGMGEVLPGGALVVLELELLEIPQETPAHLLR